jgi:hypothetical protein
MTHGRSRSAAKPDPGGTDSRKDRADRKPDPAGSSDTRSRRYKNKDIRIMNITQKFLKDIDDLWKQESRAFYREEEKNRRFFPHLSAYDHKQLSGLTHFEVLEHLGKRAVFDYTQRDPVTGNAGMRVI